jgi:hypothetical protein
MEKETLRPILDGFSARGLGFGMAMFGGGMGDGRIDLSTN